MRLAFYLHLLSIRHQLTEIEIEISQLLMHSISFERRSRLRFKIQHVTQTRISVILKDLKN